MSTTVKFQHAIVFTTLILVIFIVALVAFLAPMSGPNEYVRPVTRVVIPVNTTKTWTTRTTWTTTRHGATTATEKKNSDSQKYDAVAVVGPGVQSLVARGKRNAQPGNGQGNNQKMNGVIKTGRMSGPDGSGMQISGQVTGLTPGGVYGVTMHQYGDTTKGCNALGPGMMMGAGWMGSGMAGHNQGAAHNHGAGNNTNSSGSNSQRSGGIGVPYVIPGVDYSSPNVEYYGIDPNGVFNKMNPVMSSGTGTSDYHSNRSNPYITGSNVNFLPIQTVMDQNSMSKNQMNEHGKSSSSSSAASNSRSGSSNSQNSGSSSKTSKNGDSNNGNNYQHRSSGEMNSNQGQMNGNHMGGGEMGGNHMGGGEMGGNHMGGGEMGGNHMGGDWNQNNMGGNWNQNNMGENSRGKRQIEPVEYNSVDAVGTYDKMNPEMWTNDQMTNDHEDYNGTLIGTFMANGTGCGEFVYFVLVGVADACGDVAVVYGRSVAIRPIYGTYDEMDANADGTNRVKRHVGPDSNVQAEQNPGMGSHGMSNQDHMNGMNGVNGMGGMGGMKGMNGMAGPEHGQQGKRGGFTSPAQMQHFGMGPGMRLGMPESCGVFARM